MQLHTTSADMPVKLFTGYRADALLIDGEAHRGSLLLCATRLTPWRPASFAALLAEDFAVLLDWAPELVLLGTGRRQCFPAPRLLAPLIDAHVGCEVMDTAALCRTYNILVMENRRVVAAVLGEDLPGGTRALKEAPLREDRLRENHLRENHLREDRLREDTRGTLPEERT